MTDLFEVQLLIDELTVPQRDALLNRIINEFRILYTGEGYYTYKYINQLDKYQLSLVEKWLKPVIAEKKKEERLHSLKNLKQEIERQQLLKQELEKTLIEIQSVKQLIKKEQKPSIIKDLNEELEILQLKEQEIIEKQLDEHDLEIYLIKLKRVKQLLLEEEKN